MGARLLGRPALTALLAILLAAAPLHAGAQAFPNRALRLVVPFGVGGNADLVARLVGQKLSEGLGQPVIVENRLGAGGMIANEFVAKSRPDGYTLLLLTGAFAIQTAMFNQLPYDAIKDFSMLSTVTIYPFVVVVRSETQYKTLQDLVAYAKANPKKLNYGSSGIGSTHHLAVELFNGMAGTEIVHVPFRTATVNEILGGSVDVIFEVLSDALPHVKSGRLRALAVTSTNPLPLLPDLPPVAQTYPGYDVTTWLGLAAAAGTPPAIVERLNQEIRRVLALPEIAQRFQDLSIPPQPSSPDQMRQYIENEMAKWKQVVETRKIERITIK